MLHFSIEFFHNCHLIKWIHQNKICKQLAGLGRDWTQITCLVVNHPNYYTRKVFCACVRHRWILFMHGWFCPIRLIHLIRWKSVHFEKLECRDSVPKATWCLKRHGSLYLQVKKYKRGSQLNDDTSSWDSSGSIQININIIYSISYVQGRDTFIFKRHSFKRHSY